MKNSKDCPPGKKMPMKKGKKKDAKKAKKEDPFAEKELYYKSKGFKFP